MIKFLFLIFFFSFKAFAALDVTISQGKVEPTPIAITQVFGNDADTARYGNTIREIISNNLSNSGLFYLFLVISLPLSCFLNVRSFISLIMISS